MEQREIIMVELTELLEKYYNGSFSQMACDYFRSVEMEQEEVEELLDAMRAVSKVKAHS